MLCRSCPRKCTIERDYNTGFCGVGTYPRLAKAFLHRWEEPCISGTNGSGTVFFSGCNLKCIYCQNYHISQDNFGRDISIEDLSSLYLSLQKKGAHNINLVNPTHYSLEIKESIGKAAGLEIPVIYNSNGYETTEAIEMLEDTVDVFLPDIKYFDSQVSKRYSNASDYFEVASAAVMKMYRQAGNPVFDEKGLIKRGLIIRHLILPGLTSESIKILDWIKANIPEDVFISLMSQYTPFYRAEEYPEINRRITRREYEKVLNHLYKLGLEKGYVQERSSADEQYIPKFDLEGLD